MKRLLVILLFMLTGCAATQQHPAAVPVALFSDAAFAPPSQNVGADALFTLSPAMREYVHSTPFQNMLRARGKEQGLVDALYSKQDLKLEYESTYTRTAAETFRDRVGNCLSMVIMTAAFAKELDLQVQYQSVDMETWSRGGDLYLLSGHVNVMLGTRPISRPGLIETEQVLLVDFIPSPKLDLQRMHRLGEDEIVAMFMNNRAAESLVQGRLDDAYWWARAAVEKNPRSAISLNTLGVIYERHGNLAMAESVYRAALGREPENLATLNNLQPVLAALGKTAEAQALAQLVARLEPVPPFQYFNEGVSAYRDGKYDKARELFAREVRRAPYNDEFHFWLAASQLQLGETRKARDELTLALENSTQAESRKRYSAKLSHLRQMGMR